jgi:hypothetical protein
MSSAAVMVLRVAPLRVPWSCSAMTRMGISDLQLGWER